ncbi:hypothetical protein [Mycetocola saprophilus]|uniref:hypothetical protein n=1 Tax=Mycetocola saprophilus TaxID=76636 RepID=UPI003BF047DD
MSKIKAALSNVPDANYIDVTVTIESVSSNEIERLTAEAIKAEKAVEKNITDSPASAGILARIDELREQTKNDQHTVRITRAPGDVWTDIVSAHLPRKDNVLDKAYGFNMDAVCRAAAAYGALEIDGDETASIDLETFTGLLKAISGFDASKIVDAAFTLNIYGPKVRSEALGKAFGVAANSELN